MILLAATAALASVAQACDTPVYRYAMYRWLPAPYEVYCFHQSEIDDVAKAVKADIEAVSEAEDSRANVVFLPVDLEKDPDLKTVPPDVKQAWEANPEQDLPSYLISSPFGIHLYSGKLTKKQLPALISSPAREEMANQLEQGRAGVFVFLPGASQEANQKAENVIQGVVDDVKSGKVQLYVSPALAYAAEDEDNAVPQTEVGFVKIDRSDKAEEWFIRCLLTLEPDLKDTEEPILFTVYGRGRALFSCLGEGIHRDNLLQDIEFITGACSCTVKEQNPGVDLLVKYDWEAAAASVAEKYGAEEGSRYHFGGDSLFPELIIPSGDEEMDGSDATDEAVAAKTSEEPSEGDADQQTAQIESDDNPEPAKEDAESAETKTPSESQPIEVPQPLVEQSSDVKTEAVKNDDAGAGTQIASKMSTVDAESADAEPAMATRGVLFVGIGLVVTLIILFGATFVVLRPK
jgi:hypothetical protein